MSWLTFAVLFVMSQLIGAQTPTEILSGARLIADSSTLKATMEMSIAAKDGTKKRSLEIYASFAKDRSSKTFVRIKSPEFLRNMKLLRISNAEGKSETWIRTSQGTRRIAGGGTSESVFDSDFTTEDFGSFDRGAYRALRIEELPGGGSLRVFAEPLGVSEWREIRVSIEKKSMLISMIEYVLKNGTIGKVYRLLEKQELEGAESTKSCIMENPRRGSATTLKIIDIELGLPIKDSLFSKGSL